MATDLISRLAGEQALSRVAGLEVLTNYAKTQGDYAKTQGDLLGDATSASQAAIAAKVGSEMARDDAAKSALDVASSAVRPKAAPGPLFELRGDGNRPWLRMTPTDLRHVVIDALRTASAALQTKTAAIGAGASPETVFQLMGANRRPWFLITPTRIRHPVIDAVQSAVTALQSAVGSFGGRVAPLPLLQFIDTTRRPFFSVSPDRIRHKQVDQLANDVDTITGRSGRSLAAVAEYLHFISDGQSLSLGWGADAVSTSALAYALAFNGGARAQDGGSDAAANHQSLQPFAERTFGAGSSRQGETPLAGAFQMMAQMLAAENGIDVAAWNRRWIGSAPGTGGTAIAGLGKGSGSFTRLVADMSYGASLAAAAGKTYQPQAIFWSQGETDNGNATSAATYRALLRALRTDAEAQARASSGIADMVLPLITYQVASHVASGRAYPEIGLAQLDLATDAAIAMACPTYFLPFDPNNVPHLTSIGYKWLGAYFGLAAKRWLIDGVKPVPLRPTAIRRSGKTLLVRFPVSGKQRLVVDTSIVTSQPNLGFSLIDSGGSAQAINNVRLVGTDTVALDCTNMPAVGWKVRYGFTGDSIRGLGNIRDNTGDTLIFDPGGIAKPMHQWAPIFEQEVS